MHQSIESPPPPALDMWGLATLCSHLCTRIFPQTTETVTVCATAFSNQDLVQGLCAYISNPGGWGLVLCCAIKMFPRGGDLFPFVRRPLGSIPASPGLGGGGDSIDWCIMHTLPWHLMLCLFLWGSCCFFPNICVYIHYFVVLSGLACLGLSIVVTWNLELKIALNLQ